MRALGFILLLGATACSVRVHPVTLVEIEPPAAKPEPTPSTRTGYLWVRGHWELRGSRWSWRAGEWVKIRPGYAWYDGDWERHGNRWHWVEGHWRPIEAAEAGGGGSR